MRKKTVLLLALLLVCFIVVAPEPVAAGPLENFYESPIPYWDDDSTSPVTLTWNSGDQTINITGGDASGNLTLGIPLERADTQQVSVMMGVGNLTSTVRFELCDADTKSGQYADVNGTHVVFRDDSYGNLTDEVVLDFYAWDAHNRFWITAYNDTGLIKSFERWYGLSGNNWLNLTSTAFNGTLTLYYVSGDVDYTVRHDVPEWDASGTPDANVYQTIPLAYVDTGTVNINHDMSYTIAMPHFAYLRTEQTYDITAAGAGDGASGSLGDGQGFDLEFTMWDSNGNEDIYVKFHIESYDNTIASSIKVESNITVRTNGVDWGHQVAMGSNTIANNADSVQHIGIWRNLDNTLGVMWSSSTYLYEFDYTGHSTDVDDHATWMSEDAWTDWSNCSLTLSYDIYHEISGSFDFVEWCGYQFFEYDIYSGSGVAQPHFSTVWWTGSSGGGWSDYTAPFYSEEDAYTNDGDPEIPWWLGPIVFVLELISMAIAGIGAAIAGALIAIVTGAGALAYGFLNLVWPGAGTAILDTLGNLVSGFVSTVGLAGWFIGAFAGLVGWMISIIQYVGALIIEFQYFVMLMLILPPLAAFAGGASNGDVVEGAQAAGVWLKRYAMVGLMILTGFYKVGMGILNLIGNFIPMT